MIYFNLIIININHDIDIHLILILILISMLNHIIDANPVTWLGNKLFKPSTLLADLADHIARILSLSNHGRTQKVFFTLGVAALTYKLVHFLHTQYKMWNWLPQHLKNSLNFKPEALKQRYGHCYVLITGAADGIGYAYARFFAKLGFDLIMVDIQGQKLEFKKKQLLETFSNIKIQTFVVDMSREEDIRAFVNKIDNQQIDIGILINNVGMSGGGKYLQIDQKIMRKTLVVNFLPSYLITQRLLPKMRSRKHRSAIINMSSITGAFLSQNVGTYSSIKHALDIYSRTLSIENRDKIDILSVRPAGVSTGMMKMRKQDANIISPQHCVSAIMKDLGHCDTSFSGFPHKVMGAYFGLIGERKVMDLYQRKWDQHKNKK